MNITKQTSSSIIVLLFSLTLAIQAALIFFVQPMTGKMLLPLVGGSASVWNVVMAFFQLNLLVGYGLANFTARLSVIWQTFLLLLLYLISFALLPFNINEEVFAEAIVNRHVTTTLFWQLVLSIGLPFTALSMTTPTLQRLFTRTSHKDAQDPYFLYAASNIGSFIGLLSYPLVFEPLSSVPWQLDFWVWIFAVTIVFILMCLFLVLKNHKPSESAHTVTPPIHNAMTWKRRFHVFILAAVPSSLMLGVTTAITQEIGAFPLLWVIPLALYLLTFVYAFSRRRSFHITSQNNKISYSVIVLYSCLVLIPMLVYKWLLGGIALLSILMLLSLFLIAAMACHTRLVDERPPADKLTEFYFIMSLGGAAGGSFNAFLAPLIFATPLELPLVLALSLVAVMSFGKVKTTYPDFIQKVVRILFLLCLAVLAFQLSFRFFELNILSQMRPFLLGVSVILGLGLTFKPRYLLVFLILAVLVFQSHRIDSHILDMHRNFFGIVKIQERMEDTKIIRSMAHGSTNHGFAIMNDEQYYARPLGYYHPNGPLQDINQTRQPENIAIFGLGTGQLGCFFDTAEKITFYEIDPDIEDIAREWFPFLKECPTDIVIGDARISLRDVEDGTYDLIIIDAFSSDSIPLHLLTTHAMTEYRQKLSPDGILLFHISNRYYDLRLPLAANALATDATARMIHHTDKTGLEKTEQDLMINTIWFAMSWDDMAFDSPLFDKWETETKAAPVRPWTDYYSNPVGNFFYTLNKLKKDRD